ncbi:MAG: DUF2752 domain-containing protein, partial [Acidimicrobiales bacterium]
RTPRATAVAAAVGAGAVAWVTPCPLHAATGLWCPLCGSTRAARAFVHGHASDVWRYNALLPIALVAAVGFGLIWLAPSRRFRLSKSVLWIGLAVLVAFGVARNLPGLAVLRPHR